MLKKDEPNYGDIPREGSVEGPRVFYSPDHKANGHLDTLGGFVPHGCPEGFKPDKKGGIVAIEPAAPTEVKEESGG